MLETKSLSINTELMAHDTRKQLSIRFKPNQLLTFFNLHLTALTIQAPYFIFSIINSKLDFVSSINCMLTYLIFSNSIVCSLFPEHHYSVEA